MSSSPSRSPHRMSASRSFHASQPSSSRPFLNMLNPMARQYQGYSQANQSLLEEEESSGGEGGDTAAEEGRSRSRSTIFQSTTEDIPLAKSRTNTRHRVSWDAPLHPNIQKEDALHESDDERRRERRANQSPRPKPVLMRALSRCIPSRGAPFRPFCRLTHPTPTSPRPQDDQRAPSRTSSSSAHEHRPAKQMRGLDAYERALWNWVNVYNLDAFLQEVYYYYEGKGIYGIALARGLNLLTVGFVIGFSTFLLGCVDYSRIRHETSMKLADVVVDRCVSRFSGFTLLFFILFIAFYVWQIVTFVLGVFRLVDMYNFFTHLLKIPDADIQTISWPEIVRRIGAIREDNPLTALSSNVQKTSDDTTTAKLDAHDIANRILRQENYLIALFNKDLLDLRVPMPSGLKRFITEEEGKGTMLTRALEWNLRFCLMEYLFDQHGKVRKVFLKSKNRPVLIEGREYHKDPSTIGGRRYTSYAQWKFREFNELPHLFTRRLDESHPFPTENLTLIMRCGSFVAVLFLATVLDPDIFVHFEITPHRTVLFYLGVFGSVLAENRVFDPELLMTEVIAFTHYMPDEWKGQLHSKRIHKEFGQLFAMKVLIFVEELVSVVLTPFVLWFSLPNCAPAIIDFFREFTVHVDGRGYVCSFAEFNFERHGNVKFGAPTRIQDKRMISNEGKMEKSFLNFKAANPDWNPTDPSGSLYLSRMADFSVASYHHPLPHPHPGSILRRRPGPSTTAGAAPELAQSNERQPEGGGGLGERAQEYDRALRQSQHAATRRAGRALGGSVLGMSTLAMPGPGASSVFHGGLETAQTAVLGDSQGSVPVLRAPGQGHGNNIMEEDISPDGGVGSGLGESYVDGGRQALARQAEGEEEGDGLEDGGVLGLLAQIYGRREGPARVI
ncbi:putative transmembrane protein [Mycena galericulata]|nr:putative transmembrane protein [Mycena galericulata]